MSEKKEFTPPDFLQIPYLVYENRNLNQIDGIIYGIIYWFDKLKDGKCIASNTRISKVARCTPGTVANSLTRLEKEGYIKRTFQDEKRKKRNQIIPLVVYARVSSTDERVSSTDETRVSSTDEQNKKSPIKKITEKISEGYSQGEETTKLVTSSRRDLKIVGSYFKRKRINLPTKAVFDRELRRGLAEAKIIKDFPDATIKEAFEVAQAQYPVWTLETVGKIITNL